MTHMYISNPLIYFLFLTAPHSIISNLISTQNCSTMRFLKPLAFLLIFNITGTLLFAQSNLPMPQWHFMDKATIPAPTDDMPEYARLLYANEVNMIELEQAFRAHYEVEGWEEQLEDLEHNPYAKFYNQWYQAAQNYVDDEGMVKALRTRELLDLRTRARQIDEQYNTSTGDRSPSSTWSFLGPKRTIWRVENNSSQPVAPWQVNIYSIAVAPSNPSVLYAGSETGALYKSIDKGLNWTPFNEYNWGRAILSVAIHPTNPDIVYAATSTDIFKTTTGGISWSIVLTESGLSCNTLAISPSTPSTIFAGTSNGLYKSTDSGASWVSMINEPIDDVQFRPNDGSTIYALARISGPPDYFEFYKSTDSGVTFNLSMSGWGDVYEHSGGRLSVTPANADYIYAMLLTQDINDENQKPLVLKSTDSAATWDTIAVGLSDSLALGNGQGYYDLDIVASHSNADHVITATNSAYRSTDGGANWTGLGGYVGDFAIHPDMQEMISIMDGAVENTWITTDGGVNFSSDFYADLANWEARIDGLDGTDFWGFAQGWNEDYIIGGRYHNGNTALHENYPDQQALRMGGAESVTGWAMHGRERYAAFDDIAESIIPDQIDEAVEGSFLFTKHPQTYYYGDAFSRVMIDLEDYMTVYLGDGNSFWKSEDGGASWEATYTFGGKPYHFDISRANPDYIYLTADDGFYRSTDRGESFTEMSLPPGMSDWHSQNFRVAASSTNQDVVWVLNHRSGATSSAGRVFVSNNGGASWTDQTTSTLSGRKWTAIAHQAGTDGGVYIASRRGDAGTNPAKVMYRDNSMSDWADFSDGLPESANPIKLLPFYRDNKLRWGGNRGAWEVDFYEENWSPIAQPFVSGKTQICLRDTVNFDSYSVAKGTATYTWSIPGASWTSNLNQREVQAIFPADGAYTATLTINQSGQSDSKSIEVIIGNECDAEQTPGNALSLSGASSDYVATNEALNVTSNTMTFSTWIKRNGNQNAYSGIVFMRQGTANGLNFRDNNELGYHWENTQWWWSSGLTVPDNEWAHVAMVVSPSGVTLYLNGESATNAYSVPASAFNGVMNFGADPNWSARRFAGEMDEVLIYNRSLSQDEIRELMHLTRMPEDEVDLLGYWQFNRMSGIITDRVGSNHASLIGSATRSTSTAPVGPGESARLDVTSGGTYTFGTTDLSLEFPVGGTIFPDGELCVTRLDHAPDQSPANDVTPSYWIVHNYGNNSTFDELSSLTFENIEVSTGEAADPSLISLFKRNSNDDGNTWADPQDFADAATAGTNGSATFNDGNGQTAFSQFILAFKDAPLDAELTNFEVWLNNNKEVELKWESVMELNLAHYDIQRSKNGNTFETINQVAARGNSNTIQTYQALDKEPHRGVSYYRLKVVDQDGSFTFSEVRSIVINALADKVILYPNPLTVSEKLQIKTELDGLLEFRLYTIDGDDAGAFSFEGDAELSLKHLPAGAYSYIIRSASWRKAGVLVVKPE